MSDLEQRVKILEQKVKMLEETLQTLKATGSVNAVLDGRTLDFKKENEAAACLSRANAELDEQIKRAISGAGTFSDDVPTDLRYFSYKEETGMVDSYTKEENAALSGLAGKGLRITRYKGFENDKIIIPNEINGRPVISIGEKAFINVPASEVILPKSLKAIFKNAFNGCSYLKHIDLPDTIEHLGSWCFAHSGIEDITLPPLLDKVPEYCCYTCKRLKKVSLGKRITVIGKSAFQKCVQLREIPLPETLLEVESGAFQETSIGTIVFPSGVKKVAKDMFSGQFARPSREVVCVFLGKNTTVEARDYEPFYCASLIYCLSGSNIQRIARERAIPIKPLSAFEMKKSFDSLGGSPAVL